MTGGRPSAPGDEADRAAVEAAHRDFYDAWERGDLAAMTSAWLDDDEVACVFPGSEPVRGAAAVREQWSELARLTPGIQFLFEEVHVSLRGDVALLTCLENAVTSGTFQLGPVAPFPDELAHLPSARLAVASTFVRTPAGWLLCQHMAGPVLTNLDLED